MSTSKSRSIINYYVPSVLDYHVSVLKSVYKQMYDILIPTGNYKQICVDINDHHKSYYIVTK